MIKVENGAEKSLTKSSWCCFGEGWYIGILHGETGFLGGMLASAGFRGSLRIKFLQSFGLHSAVMGALVFVRGGVLRERCLLWSFKTFQISNFLRS